MHAYQLAVYAAVAAPAAAAVAGPAGGGGGCRVDAALHTSGHQQLHPSLLQAEELRELSVLARDAAEILWEMAAMGETGAAVYDMRSKAEQLQVHTRFPANTPFIMPLVSLAIQPALGSWRASVLVVRAVGRRPAGL